MEQHSGSQIISPPEEGVSKKDRKKPGKKTGILLSGVLVVVITAAFFWYWTRTVPVFLTIAPKDSSVILNGRPVSLSESGSIEVKRGKHLLEIASPGYLTHRESLTIGLGGPFQRSISLKVQPGLLSISSEPDGAQVFINGTPYGQTPLNGQELDPGRYRVELENENYLSYSTDVDIEGQRKRTRLEAILTPAWSKVSLNTLPDGATVLVNGEEVGQTPLAMDLLVGNYELRLEMAEREPQIFSIRVPANQTIELPTRALEWKHGQLDLETTPPGAWVTVDGKVLGQTPGIYSIPSRNPVRVSLALTDHEAMDFELTVQPDQTVERKLQLKPQTGELVIETKPTKAEVYINGRIQGLSPVKLQLPVQDYEIEIRKAGYISQTHLLRPLANKTARHHLLLIGEKQGTPLTDDQIVRALIAQKKDMPREVSTPYGYKLTLIEPDTYTMGLPSSFPGREFNETEVRMRIRYPFYIGLYEVSNREYKMFKPNHDSGRVKGVSLQSGDRPVVGVSWKDAVEYCNWLSDVQGLQAAYQEVGGNFVLVEPRTDGYRLPTEAEWEYVARYNYGATDLVYPWGPSMPPDEKSGNYAGEEAKVMFGQAIRAYRDGYPATAPVGSFNTNSQGIFDLGGNVAEWCTDFYTYTYPSSPRPLVDWTGPEKGDQRVIRGSSWRSFEEKDLRNTGKRFGKDGEDDVGFRLVRSYPIIIE